MTNTPSELIRAQNLERAKLIERLSTANRILAFCKGLLMANQIIAATDPTTAHFTNTEQEALDRINAHLAGGLFGDKPTNGACRFTHDQIAAAGRTCDGTSVDLKRIGH